MSDQQELYKQHGRISALEAQFGMIVEQLTRIEGKLDSKAKDCPVGEDHEKRITALEERPEKALNTKSAKVGIWTSVVAILVAGFAILIDIFWKRP